MVVVLPGDILTVITGCGEYELWSHHYRHTKSYNILAAVNRDALPSDTISSYSG